MWTYLRGAYLNIGYLAASVCGAYWLPHCLYLWYVTGKKSVLVSVGGRSRVVSFCHTGGASKKSTLTTAVKTFQDVLSSKHDFFLQIEDNDWGAAFYHPMLLMAMPPSPMSTSLEAI